MTELEELREQWVSERPLYKEFCIRVKNILEEKNRLESIPCVIQFRVKEPAEFLKKVLRNQYRDPYNEITDKAGTRVVCTYYEDLVRVEELVCDTFVVHRHENKRLGLDYDQLGYLGIHFEVSLSETTLTDNNDEHKGLICEIQIHTGAQNVWSDISHELAYKPLQEPPSEIKRRVYRLMSLVEIFDDEVSSARTELLNLNGFQEAKMLGRLEKHFYRFTAKPYDRELSLEIVPVIERLFTLEELEKFEPLLDDFVEQNEDKLALIFKTYSQDERCNPLLFQPESLLIFQCLEKDPFSSKKNGRASCH